MHPRPSPGARSRRAAAVLTGLGLVVATVGTVGPATAAPAQPTPEAVESFDDGRYVVTLVGDPAATYTGGVAGLEATKPDAGETLDAEDPAVAEYSAFLEAEQEDVAAAVDAEPERQYTTAVNGFAADLTAEQAATLALQPGVVGVERDVALQLDTIDSPAFLGLSGEGGLWEQLGGPGSAGEGVVVGVLDSGIAAENPSFAGDPVTGTVPGGVGSTFRTASGGIGVVKADGDVFEGECEVGGTFTADLCNDKLVSARAFNEGFRAANPGGLGQYDEYSPRDGDGHGSHTAGTAAGNAGVEMTVDGRSFGQGSGAAPGAKLATYKVCYTAATPTGGGCYTSDSVDAIEAAILDGVDVLNFSISGSTTTSVGSAVEMAFLSAASAGIFVAASAGNSGPGASTVAHNSPWLTTVAASTHHYFYGTVETGDGRQYRGISVTEPLPEQTETVLSTEVGLAGRPAAEVALCYPGALDPAEVAGKVVVCDRGVIARTDKSLAVRDAGGAGMVLANVTTASVDADVHYVPTVHVDEVAGAAIKAYVAAAEEPTTALLQGDQTGAEPEAAPAIAGFSSRGPALAHGGDLLKPDISAPGVSVLAAVAPGPNEGRDFNFLSGTSMSSPHVAGLAAIVMGERPEWSPMAVKSAMMTTAYDLSNPDGSTDADRFSAGAGHVDPTRFLDPGLVYESDDLEWLSFLEASEGVDFGIDGVDPMGDPSDLNQASIAVGALAGQQTITRTVTATRPGTYRATASVPGMDVRVTPRVLSFTAAGQSRTYQVRLTRTSAAAAQYAQGSLTWSGNGLSVRSPVVARPITVAAPATVEADVADGSVSFPVTVGTSQPVDVTVAGFVPGERETGDLTTGAGVGIAPNASTDVYPVTVADGTDVAHMELSGTETASLDLDLYVTNAANQVVARSTLEGSDEVITLRRPAPGAYKVHVHAFGTPAGQAASYELDTFLVNGSAGNAIATPDPLRNRIGYARDLTVSWAGLEEGTPYVGAVTYAGAPDVTVVALD